MVRGGLLTGVGAAGMLNGVDGAAKGCGQEDTGASYTESNSLLFPFWAGWRIIVRQKEEVVTQ